LGSDFWDIDFDVVHVDRDPGGVLDALPENAVTPVMAALCFEFGLRIMGKTSSEFAQQIDCSLLPANSDDYELPFHQSQSEFVGRRAGDEGIFGVQILL
jgi:hypothetical protein